MRREHNQVLEVGTREVRDVECRAMELPVSPASYEVSPQAMVRAVRRADAMLLRTCCEEQVVAGATCFGSCPGGAGRAFDVGDEVSQLEGVLDWFAQRGERCGMVDSATGQWPQKMAKLLRERGYEREARRVLRWQAGEGDVRRGAEDVQIIPARAAYGEVESLLRQVHRAAGGGIGESADDWVAARLAMLDETRLEALLARIDRRPAGLIGVVTAGAIGVLHELHVDRSSGDNGRATSDALLGEVTAFAQRAMFEAFIATVGDGDDEEARLGQHGFVHVAGFERYVSGE